MSLHAPDPSAARMDEARTRRVGEYMDGLVSKRVIPCHLTVVARRGAVACVHASGTQNSGEAGSLSDRRTEIARDTIFRIFSMTKPITSVALMQLFEQGKLLLSDPVHLYLGERWKKQNMSVYAGGHPKTPGDPVRTAPCKTHITILQLLTHTSGLSYGFDAEGVVNAVDAIYAREGVGLSNPAAAVLKGTATSYCEKLAEQPLLFQPGTCFHYGVNTDVIGAVVEAISGMRLSEYMQRHIFGPLKMVDTAFWVPPEKRSRFADVYFENPRAPAGAGLVNVSAAPQQAHYTAAAAPPFESGGSGLVSTAGDYYRFCQCMLNGGHLDGAVILSPSTARWVGSNHLPGRACIGDLMPPVGALPVAAPGVGFGLGFAVVVDPAAGAGQISSVGDLAWMGLANTYFWIDREQDMIVICMTQVLQHLRKMAKNPVRAVLSSLCHGAIAHDPPGARAKL